MRQKMLNIQEDIYPLLQQEPNASFLVNKLLREHYLTNNKSKEELINKEKKIIDELQNFNEEKKLELNKVELEVKKIESIELTKEQKEEKDRLKQEEKEIYVQSTALQEISRELTKEELKQYFNEVRDNKTNIYLFLDTIKQRVLNN
jgi:hypothetical protein